MRKGPHLNGWVTSLGGPPKQFMDCLLSNFGTRARVQLSLIAALVVFQKSDICSKIVTTTLFSWCFGTLIPFGSVAQDFMSGMIHPPPQRIQMGVNICPSKSLPM